MNVGDAIGRARDGGGGTAVGRRCCAWRAAMSAGAHGIVHFTARYNVMHWRAGNGSA